LGVARNFIGQIDEARIWNVARTEAELKANMYKQVTSGTGLVAAYQMTNGSGTSLTDNSGNGNTGTLSAAVTWKTSAAFESPGYTIDFDGVNDNIVLANGNIMGNNYTVELWYYPTDATAVFRGLLGGNGAQSTQRAPCIYQYGQNIHFGHSNGTTWFSDNTTSNVLTINSWNHIALSFNGTSFLLYINGQLVYTSAVASGISPYAYPIDRIGALDNFSVGRIDEVRLWNTTRSAAEIRDGMMRTLRGNETGLIAYYRMDERNGTIIYDLGPNGRNGTLTNMDAATDRVYAPAFTTWNGNTSNSWTDATNWSTGIPSTSLSAGVYKYTLGNEASISGNPIVSNILVSSGATPVCNSGITVNGNLLVEKDLLLNGQTISLGTNATLVEENAHCYGNTGSISITRNLSNINALNVGGLGATITTAANMGSTTIARFHTVAMLNGIFRYYNITPTNNTGLNATLVFNYTESELNGNNENNLALFRSTDLGETWTQQTGSTVNTTSNTITLTGIDAFSSWTAGPTLTPLPLQWISFKAKKIGRDVLLSWQTIHEYLTKDFIVQHSTDGSRWETIGQTNSNTAGVYSYNHQNPGQGLHFYRIQSRDLSGVYHYSEIVNVLIANNNLNQSIFPNPSTNGYVYVQMEKKGTVGIYDQTGRYVQQLQLEEGLQKIITAGLPAGVYRIVMEKNLHYPLLICK
jgi:hypothetical protein